MHGLDLAGLDRQQLGLGALLLNGSARFEKLHLLDAASRGELTDAASIETQARRMLEDPRARTAAIDFHRQWLFFDRILGEEQ